jgi:IMS family HHH motif
MRKYINTSCSVFAMYVNFVVYIFPYTHPCPHSAGVGPNMLLARLATKKAKPNGHCALGLLSRSAAHMSRLDATIGVKGDDEGEYPLHDSLPLSPFDIRSPHRPQQQHTERDKDTDKDKQQLLEATPADREIREFLESLPLGELPGVGYKLDKKLKEKNLLVCGDIWNVRKESLKVRTSILRDCSK